MASITSTGIGSGLDIAGLVQQLVAAEATPVSTRIAQKEARVQTRLSAFGNLKSALSDFRDQVDKMRTANSFLTRKATSGNEEKFAVSVSESALPATYSVEVAQLAQTQKLTSGTFNDKDTVVGTGTLTITVGTAAFNIDVTTENNTLAGIRDSINGALDNTGVSATIVNADAGSYLILTGENTGAANSMTVTQAGGDGGLAALDYDPGAGLNSMTESIAAQDALVRIDGFDVLSSTNTITGAVDGVTLNLLQADPGLPASLQIDNDTEAVTQLINDFVASYNALVETFDQLTSYDADSELAGPLLGDATIRGIRDQIRREFSTNVENISAPFNSLGEIGVEIQLDGKLAVTGESLATVLDENFSSLGELFAATDGFAVRLFDLTDSYLATGGIIASRTEGLNRAIEEFSDQREALGDRLASLEGRLLRQFNALDSLIGQLNQTSNFLSQQLSNLPGFVQRDRN